MIDPRKRKKYEKWLIEMSTDYWKYFLNIEASNCYASTKESNENLIMCKSIQKLIDFLQKI